MMETMCNGTLIKGVRYIYTVWSHHYKNTYIYIRKKEWKEIIKIRKCYRWDVRLKFIFLSFLYLSIFSRISVMNTHYSLVSISEPRRFNSNRWLWGADL